MGKSIAQRQIDAHLAAHGHKPKDDAESSAQQGAEKNDLGDGRRQQEILHPAPTTVELSFGEQKFFPVSMAIQREIVGFFGEEAMDVQHLIADGPEDAQASRAFARMIARFNRFPEKARELFRLAAYALDEPGRITRQQAEEMAAEFFAKANQTDTGAIFFALCKAVGMWSEPKAAARAKN